MTKDSKISLCMITRDEEQYLGKCLESVAELVDEIVIVDTGSVDSTMDIAREHGARVLEFEWVNDFSKARNYSIRNATSQWVLALDADEVISRKDHEKLKKLTEHNKYDAFMLMQRNYTNSITDLWKPNTSDYDEGKNYTGYDEVPVIRLFKNRENIFYRGNIHELVRSSNGETFRQKLTDIPIHHYGRVRCSADMMKKREHYLAMNLVKVQLEPNNPKAYLELGRQYFECGKYDKAIEALKESLRIEPNQELALFDLAVSHWKSDDLDEAEGILKKLTSEKPSPAAFTMLGIVYMERQEVYKALKAFGMAIENDPDYIPAYNNIGIMYSKVEEHEKSIPFFQAALEINPNYSQARGNLALAYERTSDLGEAVKTYKDLLAREPNSAPFVQSRLKAIEKNL